MALAAGRKPHHHAFRVEQILVTRKSKKRGAGGPKSRRSQKTENNFTRLRGTTENVGAGTLSGLRLVFRIAANERVGTDNSHSARDFCFVSDTIRCVRLTDSRRNPRRMKGVVDRLALFFNAGWQWLTAAPRYRGALLCGLSLLGAMIAIGYNGSKGILAPSAPVTQTNDVVAARISAMSAGSGASHPENLPPKDRMGDAEVAGASSEQNDSRSGKEGPSAKAIALDKSFLVAETEKKAAIRDKEEVKKTANQPKKKTQRRVSTERDRKFDPSREIKRAGEKITRVIRDIF